MRNSLHVAFVFVSLLVFIPANADNPKKNGDDAAVHIVLVVPPPEGAKVDLEAYHLHFLVPVLGSKEAARKALVYSYESIMSGFAAKLTPKQASELSKQPGVLEVMPDKTYHLVSEGSGHHQPDVV